MDLFRTWCHRCHKFAHCRSVNWRNARGGIEVRLLCADCRRAIGYRA